MPLFSHQPNLEPPLFILRHRYVLNVSSLLSRSFARAGPKRLPWDRILESKGVRLALLELPLVPLGGPLGFPNNTIRIPHINVWHPKGTSQTGFVHSR